MQTLIAAKGRLAAWRFEQARFRAHWLDPALHRPSWIVIPPFRGASNIGAFIASARRDGNGVPASWLKARSAPLLFACEPQERAYHFKGILIICRPFTVASCASAARFASVRRGRRKFGLADDLLQVKPHWGEHPDLCEPAMLAEFAADQIIWMCDDGPLL